MNPIRNITILLIMIFVLGIVISGSQSQTDIPNISEKVAILQVDDKYDDFDDPLIIETANQFPNIEMSLNGRYIIGHTSVREQSGQLIQFNLYIWDTDEFEFDRNVIFPNPHISLSLDEPTNYAISSNNQYLVLSTETTLKILTLPDLEFVNEISMSSTISELSYVANTLSKKFALSHDSSVLAVLVENETSVLFWEIDSEQVSITPLNVIPYPDWDRFPNTQMTSIEKGWIIRGFYEQPDIAFVFCDTVKDCKTYHLDGIFDTENRWYDTTTISSLSGLTLATAKSTIVDNQLDENNSQLIIWQFSNDAYQQEEVFPISMYPYFPLALSPSGQYLYFTNEKNYQNGILDLNIMDVMRPIDFAPTWLFEETYIGVLDAELVFHLESVDSETDIDLLDFTQIDGVNQDELIYNDEALIRGVSDDSRQVLITLGGVAALIYIEHQ